MRIKERLIKSANKIKTSLLTGLINPLIKNARPARAEKRKSHVPTLVRDLCPALSWWCGQRDLNPHGFPLDPKSSASANSAMSAKRYFAIIATVLAFVKLV
jgi:hypothetical protein